MKNEKTTELLSKRYTFKEELANSITHGLGVVFGIIPAYNACKLDPIKAIYR